MDFLSSEHGCNPAAELIDIMINTAAYRRYHLYRANTNGNHDEDTAQACDQGQVTNSTDSNVSNCRSPGPNTINEL